MNIACLLVVPVAGLLAAGQPPSEFYRVGTGRVDITPEGPIWLAGYGDRGVDFGVNRDGPVDHGVSVLRIDGTDGRPRAIVFGYACHCTTLTGDYYRISGDWAGYAEDYLERAHPGATAFFVDKSLVRYVNLVRYVKPTFLNMLRLGVKRFPAALGL